MNFSEMNDKELYEYCRLTGRKAREWKNRFVAALPEVARRELHRKKGFATVVEFAAKVGGVGKKTVETVFQVEKRLADKPELKKLIPKVGINKVRIVATLATRENQVELAEKVKTLSKPALELFAREQRAPEIPPGRKREMLSFAVDEEVALKLRKFKNKLGTVEWNDVMKELLKAVEEKPKKVRLVKPVKKVMRYVPASKQRSLSDHCVYPGCNKPAEQIHHPQRFSLSKNHENLKPLCKAHHELVHNGHEPQTWNPHPLSPLIDKKFNRYRQEALL
jgi:hypothetical protein